MKVFPDTPPPTCPPSVEKEENGTLTIEQLDNLREQFLDVAPQGRKTSYRKRAKKVKIKQDGHHWATSKMSSIGV
jgi:hypothetical protein